jgi:hypothetical protein
MLRLETENLLPNSFCKKIDTEATRRATYGWRTNLIISVYMDSVEYITWKLELYGGKTTYIFRGGSANCV